MRWRGNIFLEHGWLLYEGPIAATSAHAHHAFQIILESQPAVQLVAGSERVVVDVAAIPADAPHAFASPASRAVILYVAPESRAGRHLAAHVGGDTPIASWIDVAVSLRGIVGDPIDRWEEARRVY
ncbi:MAG TPA: hypothetical protein VK427_05500, partial [Kofleriaceae bacterium]|nr:hypothetical protein [Kofleriaceae bacterium]